MQFTADRFTFTSNAPFPVEMSVVEQRPDYLRLRIRVDFGEPITPDPLAIEWTFPLCDIFSQWSPNCGFQRNLQVDWSQNRTPSRSASWMPLQTHLNLSGQNRLTVALSDVLTPMQIASGVIEETSELTFTLTLFTQRISAISSYETELVLDTRDLPYYACVQDIRRYWAEKGFPCAPAPDDSLRPIYSSWYSYHQNVDRKTLVEQMKLAKDYDMCGIIVDDGWQTTDSNRGYAYCGDWEPIRIPDMKELVEDIHALGMKYVMWYSVPFVGKYSKAFARFEGKFLNKPTDESPWCCFDPRYPDVRDYLISLYETAVREWKLDGLKLDFIDSFTLTDQSAAPNDEMDYHSLEDAVCALLREAKERLTALNPDIMIEFRQSYVGPIMSSFGNMLRVGDCPGDPLRNRIGSVDLRLTSGTSPVHSDMLLWNTDDSVESAALELINILFSVPQISVRIETLPEDHKAMLRFYLKLWNTYRDCLMHGRITALHPEANYSLVSTETDDTLFAVSFSQNLLTSAGFPRETVFVNGSWDDELLLKNTGDAFEALVTVTDCTGKVVSESTEAIATGYSAYAVPRSGVLNVVRK